MARAKRKILFLTRSSALQRKAELQCVGRYKENPVLMWGNSGVMPAQGIQCVASVQGVYRVKPARGIQCVEPVQGEARVKSVQGIQCVASVQGVYRVKPARERKCQAQGAQCIRHGVGTSF